MLLFAGLGNPGAEHRRNRHNVGFMAVDAIHYKHRFSPWRARFQGQTADGEIGGERILLLKPETYMNESGRAVGAAQRFLKIELANLIVFYDELDLPPAKIRVKTGGGNAGHNGLRSITAHCGNDYVRVRLGIGHPGEKRLVSRHVLSDFAKSDRVWVEAVCETVADNAEFLATGHPEEFQNRVHIALGKDGINPPETPPS